MNINELKSFYKNKRILITGHTGFKGSWLTQILLNYGSSISGIALNPYENSLFDLLVLGNQIEDNRINILNIKAVEDIVIRFKPEIIFHMAAQPLVKKSYLDPLETHEINYMGTANLLSVFTKYEFIKTGVFITTDKVYKNYENGIPFKEDDPFGGYDPYSASKAASEILIESWRHSFVNTSIKGIASVRAGNVIGGGDWAANRIIPDLFRAYNNMDLLKIRNPQATRPWQHVLEPLFGYLKLAKLLFENPSKYSKGWNFGPNPNDVLTVEELLNYASHKIGYNPKNIIKEKSDFHEAKLLSLDISQSKKELDWVPTLSSLESLDLTIDWYINSKNGNIKEFTIHQITQYAEKI